ncbi:MAG: diguanylate cyclase, partial [Negativicutes bacterium]|nr:diguanylate cyclase [Negativicutes bacterium]
ILLPNIAHEQDAVHALKKIIEAIERPMELAGRIFSVTASIGVALCPRDGQNVDALLQAADKAMYQEKQQKGIPAD